MRAASLRLLGCLLVVPSCTEPSAGNPFDSGSGSSSAAAETAAGSVGSAGSSAAESSGDGSDIKLDVGGGADIPVGDCVGDADCGGCTAVDLLFVIDNSGSMGEFQDALALAFPAFADTLAATLPPSTNVHVAVTSTEMEYSGSGTVNINNGVCTFEGENGQTNEDYYLPPTQADTGRNGTQGRLYDPGGGQTFVAFDTDDDLSDAKAWFADAVTIGEGGSNIEMSTAPVGWAFDPVNAATNDGFLRDEGAVLVVFFVQDEPDQSPAMVDGQPTGAWVLDRVAEAKSGCGGLDCVVAGGFLSENACSAQGNLPLDDFLAGMDDEPAVAELPFFPGDPQTVANDMNALLSNTLADVIAQTCDEIQPEG